MHVPGPTYFFLIIITSGQIIRKKICRTINVLNTVWPVSVEATADNIRWLIEEAREDIKEKKEQEQEEMPMQVPALCEASREISGNSSSWRPWPWW